jgi:hypothetical protein
VRPRDRDPRTSLIPVDLRDASSLLIVLDNLGWPNAGPIWIAAELASRTPLAQEIPTLIQFHLQRPESLAVTIGELSLPVQLVLFPHQPLDMRQDRSIAVLLCHESPSLPAVNDTMLESMRLSPPRIALACVPL